MSRSVIITHFAIHILSHRMAAPSAMTLNPMTGSSAQPTMSYVYTHTYPAFPTGVSSGETILEGASPLVCDVGCFIGAGIYP